MDIFRKVCVIAAATSMFPLYGAEQSLPAVSARKPVGDLFRAVCDRDTSAVCRVLAQKIHPDTERCHCGGTALMMLVRDGTTKEDFSHTQQLIELLVEAKASVEAHDECDDTVLHEAARSGHWSSDKPIRVAKLLITTYKASPLLKNRDGKTPADCAEDDPVDSRWDSDWACAMDFNEEAMNPVKCAFAQWEREALEREKSAQAEVPKSDDTTG